jgi:hypothetical protein
LVTESSHRSIEDTLGSLISGIVDEMLGRQVEICLQQPCDNVHLNMTIFEQRMNFFMAEKGAVNH